MHDLKSRIKSEFAQLLHLCITSFLLLPLLASNTQKVTHHLPEEVEEALDGSKDMAYNPEEEDYKERYCRND
jgi:hypothetical protein